MPASAPVIGIAGWKNSGKTTLIERLIGELARCGLRVASVKHAHHDLRADGAASDSACSRGAGTQQVAAVSPGRWVLMTQLGGAREPALADVLVALDPCDLVPVEGYKRPSIRKFEMHRGAAQQSDALADEDSNITAIAADHAVDGRGLPTFALDDIRGMADFIVATLRLRVSVTRKP